MKRGISLLLGGLVLLLGCASPDEVQQAASLTGSFTREPMLITAAAPTITPQWQVSATATAAPTEPPVTFAPAVKGTEAATLSITPTPPLMQITQLPTPTPKKATAESLCALAEKLQDSPYAPDGSGPQEGFDTAGFVYYCLNEIDIYVPKRTPRGYAENEDWDKVPYLSSAKAGDLLFFVTGEEQEIDCVCIYLGNGKMTYPSTSRGAVITVSSVTEYWKNHFRLGRRPF